MKSNDDDADLEMIAGMDADDFIAAILQAKGMSSPISEKEAASLELEIEALEVEIPASLRELPVLSGKIRNASVLQFPQQGHAGDTQEELARVAREGRAISEQVKQRMRKDRSEAEDKQRDET